MRTAAYLDEINAWEIEGFAKVPCGASTAEVGEVRLKRLGRLEGQNGDSTHQRMKNGAVEKTRTSTGSLPQRPQRCAYTSSATTAYVWYVVVLGKYGVNQLQEDLAKHTRRRLRSRRI